QQFKLIPVHTVAENVILGLREQGFVINERKINNELTQLIQRYGWTISPNSRVWQLSAGEKQQVELLKALYRKVRILILDEPTTGLDVERSLYVRDMIRKYNNQYGITVLLSSHNMLEVEYLSHRVGVLYKGKLIAEGTPGELKKSVGAVNLEEVFMKLKTERGVVE
ncbi:MAG: ATP-binding cassette domain-containing protein, partial [Zestosphaera sp.]